MNSRRWRPKNAVRLLAAAAACSAMLIAPKAAAAPAPQTVWFTSANAGYAQDLALDPTATAGQRAPVGSTLSTTAPTALAGATAVASDGGTAVAGMAASPTFGATSALTLSTACFDGFLSVPSTAGVVPNLRIGVAKPGDALNTTTYSDIASLAGVGTTATPFRFFFTFSPPVAVAVGDPFTLGSFPESTLTYGSAANPSRLVLNAAGSDCAPVASGTDPVHPAPQSPVAPSGYVSYPAPAGLADLAGEPSIGYSEKTDTTFFQASTSTSTVHWDDSVTPPVATWTSTPSLLTSSLTTLDPILATDRVTGRTMSSQLLAACSGASTTDDDGVSWQPAAGCPVPHGADHQTVGYGPAIPGSAQELIAQNGRMAYYCSQQIVAAFCGSSINGGTTFGPSTPVFTVADGCSNAFHGHVKVGPDGTVYLPNERCGGQSLAISHDHAATWTISKPAGFTSVSNLTHPSVAVSGHTVYYGNGDAMGRPVIAVSHDEGLHFDPLVNVAPQLGLQAVEFPTVVSGDEDRAAFAFLGTTTPGNYTAVGFADTGAGADARNAAVWHLYVAHTYDTGKSWVTTDVTPNDPAQRGCLWNLGTTTGTAESACRNLLDFNGITIDRMGRVLIGWADGCTGTCVGSDLVRANARTQLGTISRQTCGTGLYAAYDGQLCPTGPAADTTCASSPRFVDPLGDATQVVVSTGGNGIDEPSLDIVGGSIDTSADGKRVVFTAKVADLVDTPPLASTGRYFRFGFTEGGVVYTLAAIQDYQGTTASAPTAQLTKAGTTSTTVAAGALATFDSATDLVTASFDVATFNASEHAAGAALAGALTRNGLLTAITVTSQRRVGTVTPTADLASSPCPFTYDAIEASAAIPELPGGPAIPVAVVGLTGVGLVVRRRRRRA